MLIAPYRRLALYMQVYPPALLVEIALCVLAVARLAPRAMKELNTLIVLSRTYQIGRLYGGGVLTGWSRLFKDARERATSRQRHGRRKQESEYSGTQPVTGSFGLHGGGFPSIAIPSRYYYTRFGRQRSTMSPCSQKYLMRLR
jgi:hypothetical protein